jgi:CsoR family transcriptional regulator, copper-sensing transcriptional repressor
MIKNQALISFKKTRSLLDKIIKMLEADEYCIDIMQQNLAAIGLLRSAHQKLMEGHLNHCFMQAFSTGNAAKKKRMINEILQVTKLYNK